MATRPEKAGIVYEAIQSAGISGPDPLYALGVSRGPVSVRGIIGSLVLATGDVTSGDDVSESVVICDGDVHVKGNVGRSLIIARGSISIKGTTETNTLIAGGTVTIGKPREPTNPRAEMSSRDIIEEKAKKPLGYITFFELSTVGVEVKVADKAVTVAAIADGKTFAAAGVRVGDIVTAVNGQKPDSAESLRRLLRDALALGDATLTLNRGDKTQTVKVALPE
jgi:S1-C subfamily serine protease